MLFELTLLGSDAAPAADLGYLLHKNPFRPEPQAFPLSFGRAHVFWPEVGADRATAALLLDVDPVGLVRRPAGGEGFGLAQYVNDRPYVASSFLAVAIGEVYGTALAGRCSARPELAEAVLPLAARLAVVPCGGGAPFLARLFAPLGYEVRATRHPLDERFPAWGEGPYHTVELRGEARLRDLLAHLTVLIPVLDGAKHYYVGDDEVDKLLRRGAGWLAAHPERELIATRYLKRRRSLVREAVARLVEEDAASADMIAAGENGAPAEDIGAHEPVQERRIGLHRQRLEATIEVLKASGARRVLDLGCGEGRLLRLLLADPQFEEIVGLDVSHRSLELAAKRLKLERLPASRRERVRLLHGALTYRDARLAGFDAAAVVEVIEHLGPWRLDAFARALFGAARPGTVVLTTPNREYNVCWPDLSAGALRHPDHRFEWTRAEFREWADSVAEWFGYVVRFSPVGPEVADVGAPSQMAVFEVDQGGPSPPMRLAIGATIAAADSRPRLPTRFGSVNPPRRRLTMATTISDIEARTRIGDLLRQVAETGEPVYVEWEGKLQAAIVAADSVTVSQEDWRDQLNHAQALIQRDLAGRPLPDIDELINGGRDERDDAIVADLRRR